MAQQVNDQACHCSGSGHCGGTGSSPGLGTCACRGCGQREKRKRGIEYDSKVFGVICCTARVLPSSWVFILLMAMMPRPSAIQDTAP